MGLGSGIRNRFLGKKLFRIPDPGPGVKKAPDPGSGSATLPVCGGGGPREGVPGAVQGCPTGEPYPHLSQGQNFTGTVQYI
jgi:hypothetical protein